MRMVHTGLATIAVGFRCIWRRRVFRFALCTTAVFLGCLVIRLWTTYLPPQPDEVVGFSRDDGPSVATVQRDTGDLPRLEERVRKTAQAVLPSVVAVRNPYGKPSRVGHYQTNYASGVIITPDGIVLSQWHVSHLKPSEHGGPLSTQTAPSGSAGDRTTVILHDGRECPAELLGANRTRDVSLLRLLEPGPYPHVPIRATAPIQVGDWVLKIGHPIGYRKGRSAPVRLGRVLCRTEEIFDADCMTTGGDSGGPYFNLDGQLVGIMQARHADNGLHFMSVTGSQLIDSLLEAMRRGEIATCDSEDSNRIDRELRKSAFLRPADFSQGSATLARYRSIVEPARSSVVVVLSAEAAVSLGTIVGADGWIITKASELPAQPTCRLPDGHVVSARVAGVEPAFDLALLSVPATDLKPVRWADDFNPPVGTLLAAVGTEYPLAAGVVSVGRRDLGAPDGHFDAPPPRKPPGSPEIFGWQQVKGGYSLRAAFGLPRETVFHVRGVFGSAYFAGVREHDLLYSMNGHHILAEADMLEAVQHRRPGNVVPVSLERAGKTMELQLPVAPESHHDTSYRADGFPTVIECAVPFHSNECGGPIVNLAGRAIGVTIARVARHGGMVIPGDCVRKLLPDLQNGRLAGNRAPVRAPGK